MNLVIMTWQLVIQFFKGFLGTADRENSVTRQIKYEYHGTNTLNDSYIYGR